MVRLILIMLVLVLAGCCTPKTIEVPVVKTKVVHTAIPSELLVPCKVTKPPMVDGYMVKTMSGKEDALTEYTIALLKDISTCSMRFTDTLTAWDKKQQAIYTDPPIKKE